MSESVYTQRLAQFRSALGFVWGIAFAVFVLIVAGDLDWYGFPLGWVLLWLMTTLWSIPLGITILIGPGWRRIPLADRRDTAIAYLAVGLLNLVGLAVHFASESAGHAIWVPVIGYGLGLFAVYTRIYAGARRSDEELFP